MLDRLIFCAEYRKKSFAQFEAFREENRVLRASLDEYRGGLSQRVLKGEPKYSSGGSEGSPSEAEEDHMGRRGGGSYLGLRFSEVALPPSGSPPVRGGVRCRCR